MLWGNNYNKMTTRHKRVTRLAFALACGLRPFYMLAHAPLALAAFIVLYMFACGPLAALGVWPAARARELRLGEAGQKKGAEAPMLVRLAERIARPTQGRP